MLLAVSHPGNQLGLFRKTLKDLRESTLITWNKLFPETHPLIIKHHKTQFYYLIRTAGEPSVLHYGGLGEEGDFEAAKGKEYGAFAIDEPSEIEEDPYLQMLAQLCWTLPDGTRPPYMAILGSNPEPGWVEEKFRPLIDQTSDEVGSASNDAQIFIRALPRDNPYLPPNWERDLRASIKNKVWIDKYLSGSWDVSEGQYFKEFDAATHILSIHDIPDSYLRTLKLVASIDHATTGISCMVVDGIDPDGNVITLGSYYEFNRLIPDHARSMIEMMHFWAVRTGKEQIIRQFEAQAKLENIAPEFYAFEYILIDPSTSHKTQQNQNELTSNQDLYRRAGIPTQQAWNALEAGLELYSQYLHVNPSHFHPITGEPGSPSYFIVLEYNKAGISEITKFKRTIDDKGRIKYAGKDHWLDNNRYILMSRPEPPARTDSDLKRMSTVDRKIIESHDKWAAGWGREPDSNLWFKPPSPGRLQ